MAPQRKIKIKNETDFIMKLRNKFIDQRNNHYSLKIQTWYRMRITQIMYRTYRDHVVGLVIKV